MILTDGRREGGARFRSVLGRLRRLRNVYRQADVLAEEAVRVTESSFGILALRHEGALYPLAVAGMSWEDFRSLSAQVGFPAVRLQEDYLLGVPVRTGRPLILNDVEGQYAGRFPSGHMAIHRFLGAPIFYRKRAVGVLGVANRPEEYTDEHANLLSELLGLAPDFAEQAKQMIAVEKYRSMVEAARDILLLHDARGRIFYANRAFAARLGFSRGELKACNIVDFLDPEEAERLLRIFRLVLERQGAAVGYEAQFRRKDGRRVWLALSTAPVESQRIVALVTVATDVTDRKQAEEALLLHLDRVEELVSQRTRQAMEAEVKYRLLINQLADPVLVVQEGRIVFVNKAFCRVFAIDRDTALGIPLLSLVPPELQEAVERRMKRRGKLTASGEGGGAERFEIALVTRERGRVLFEASLGPITYEGKLAELIVLRDLTERRQLEERLARSEQLAVIGKLGAGVAHELRNPLAVIKNAAHFLRLRLQEMDDKQVQKALELIDWEVAAASEIINSILDLARRPHPRLEPTDLNLLVADVLAGFSIEDSISTKLLLDRKLPKVPVDPGQIRQVIRNLVENALQAMPKGGKLTISTRVSTDWVEIVVKDTGVGIPPDQLDKVFQPLFTTKPRGVGLGLAISRSYVEAHGGTITVKSKVGRGSRFTVKLPLNPPSNSSR